MLLFAFFIPALADDCGDLASLSLRARALMLEGRREAADAQMDRAHAALTCDEPRRPQELSQLHLSEATRRFLAADFVAADVAFVASWRADPTNWDPALGEELKRAYDDAVHSAQLTEARAGELLLAELPRGYKGSLDGRSTDFPVTAPPGEHVVQIYHRRTVVYGNVTYLPAGESIQIHTGELPPIPRPLYLIGSGVSALLAGGMAGIAVRQSDTMAIAPDLSALERAHTIQRAAAFTSYGLCGLAAAGLTLHLMR